MSKKKDSSVKGKKIVAPERGEKVVYKKEYPPSVNGGKNIVASEVKIGEEAHQLLKDYLANKKSDGVRNLREQVKKTREDLESISAKEAIAFTDNLKKDMRQIENDENIDYKCENIDYKCVMNSGDRSPKMLLEGDLKFLAKKIFEKEANVIDVVSAYKVYYVKKVSMKDNHIKFLNEELDTLRRKNLFLEAKLREVEGELDLFVSDRFECKCNKCNM